MLKVQLVRNENITCVFDANPITFLSRCISRTNQTRKRTQNGSAARVGSTKRYIGLACIYLDFRWWCGFVVYLARWISNRKLDGSRASLIMLGANQHPFRGEGGGGRWRGVEVDRHTPSCSRLSSSRAGHFRS